MLLVRKNLSSHTNTLESDNFGCLFYVCSWLYIENVDYTRMNSFMIRLIWFYHRFHIELCTPATMQHSSFDFGHHIHCCSVCPVWCLEGCLCKRNFISIPLQLYVETVQQSMWHHTHYTVYHKNGLLYFRSNSMVCTKIASSLMFLWIKLWSVVHNIHPNLVWIHLVKPEVAIRQVW